jgi:hypothetical protein
MTENVGTYADDDDGEIQRRDTGFRIGLTLLFVLISAALRSLLGLIILFELVMALITKQPPSVRVRDLANRIIAYRYRIGRYLTYNESRVPFPFDEFPQALEPDAWRADETESKALRMPAPVDEDDLEA